MGGPSVSADAEGNFVVVWTDTSNEIPHRNIRARRYASDGRPLDGEEFLVNSSTADTLRGHPRVAVAPEGEFVIAWDDEDSSGADHSRYSIQARRYRADGVPLDAAQFQVNTFGYGIQIRPAVATGRDGDFVAAWYSQFSAGTDTDYWSVQARRFRADGSPLDAADFQVNTYTTGYQWQPSVAVGPDGGFVVAWTSDGSFGNDSDLYSIQARRYRGDGTPRDSKELQVNSYTTSAQYGPEVAADGVDDFVVVWNSYGSAGSDADSWSVQERTLARRAPPFVAPDYQMNTYTTGGQGDPTIATTPDGNFVATWAGAGPDEPTAGQGGIHARRFGRPTIEVTSTSGGTGGPACTLRDAITAANSSLPTGGCPAGNEGALIELPASATIVLTQPDNGTNGLPVIEQPIVVHGHGSTVTRDPGLACPVAPEFRLFEVASGGILTLEQATISNGCLSSGSGGGVLASGGTVVLREATIEGNETGADGGGVATAGGSLQAVDSTVRGNLAAGSGGGISVSGDPGWLMLRRSTVSGNVASVGAGLAHAGAARALVRASTFSGNVALTGGGGIELGGTSPSLTLDFSTVVGNASPSGAGLLVGSGVFSLHGSLVGESSGGADCASGTGGLVATGANLDTDGSCAALAGTAVTTVASLGLAPLADNGGWAPTHLPLAGSPALDAAPACASRSGAAVIADERDYPRPTDDDGDEEPACDLGAVERGPIFLDGFESGDARRWSRSVS